MSRRRLIVAVLVGALVAVSVAVPVLAKIMSKPGESGYVRMYNYVNLPDGDASWEATGCSSVRLAYDATVDTYTINMALTGAALPRRTAFTLVNPVSFSGQQADALVYVQPLGTGTTSKLGTLNIKSCVTRPLSDGWDVDGHVWSRFSGADAWLVPATSVAQTTNATGYYVMMPSFPNPELGFIYASLGLPTDWEDVMGGAN